MNANALFYREIVSAEDPAWEAWKAIYYASFPKNERMSEDSFLQVFAEKAHGESLHKRMLVMLTGEARVIGIAYYEAETEPPVAFLWYLAMHEDFRNYGYGRQFYAELLRRMAQEGVQLLVFEVEIPSAEKEDASEWARRRIEWYRRQGAFVLEGVEYVQMVDTGVPPTPMYLMLHPLVPMDAERGYTLVKPLFPETLHRRGELKLS
jgi:ribosomal protein S18 acetylase RimI-like enzyme